MEQQGQTAFFLLVDTPAPCPPTPRPTTPLAALPPRQAPFLSGLSQGQQSLEDQMCPRRAGWSSGTQARSGHSEGLLDETGGVSAHFSRWHLSGGG